MTSPNIILASQSKYRKLLLEQLGIPFICHAADINESPKPGESVQDLAVRLAIEKTQAIAEHYPKSFIIGSDTISEFNGEIMGKPTSHEQAFEWLKAFSGNTVNFYTSLCLLNTETGKYQTHLQTIPTVFRQISDKQTETYLKKEQPYYCTAAVKVDGIGIALIKDIKTNDYSSLIGLPLIQLIDMFNNESVDILTT